MAESPALSPPADHCALTIPSTHTRFLRGLDTGLSAVRSQPPLPATIGADNIWWPVVIMLLAGTGIYLSFQTGFIQIRRLGLAIRFMFKGRDQADMAGRTGDVTPFQALMTALAATVGNGNIAGVATAIASGGPGAPFWMWMTAVFGMATKYSEGLLGLKYRVKSPDGTFSGGAMYYLRDGLRWKGLGRFLALWFSIAVILMSTFGSGNMAQSNSISLALNSDFGLPFIASGMAGVILPYFILGTWLMWRDGNRYQAASIPTVNDLAKEK